MLKKSIHLAISAFVMSLLPVIFSFINSGYFSNLFTTIGFVALILGSFLAVSALKAYRKEVAVGREQFFVKCLVALAFVFLVINWFLVLWVVAFLIYVPLNHFGF